MQIEVTLPSDTTSTYVLEVSAALSGDEPVFQICGLSVHSLGANIPCVEKRYVDYNARVTNPKVSDMATMYIGSATTIVTGTLF